MKTVLDVTVEQYEVHNKDPQATAAALGISVKEVVKRLRIAGIKIRNDGAKRPVVREDDIEQAASPLWEEFEKTDSIESRNKLADLYWPAVAKQVRMFCSKKGMQPDDFYGPAATALLETIDRFERSGPAKFLTYASHRVRGAMLDHLRESDRASRLRRRAVNARHRAEQMVGKDPEAVQKYLGWTECEYLQSYVPTQSSLQSLYAEDGEGENPEAARWHSLGRRERTELEADDAFRDLCKICTLRETVMLYLTHVCGLTHGQVGELFGLSESRVAQMHLEAAHKIRFRGRSKVFEDFTCKL